MIFTILCLIVFLLVNHIEGIIAHQIYSRLSNINPSITFEDTKKALKEGNADSRLITDNEYRKMSSFKSIRIVTLIMFVLSFLFV